MIALECHCLHLFMFLVVVSAPAAKRPTPSPSPAAGRYDPSSIYRNRVAPRAKPSVAAGVNRPPSANRQNSGGSGAGRPPSAGAAAAQRNNVRTYSAVFKHIK